MYIKTKSGDYVNSKNISGLRIKCYGGDFKMHRLLRRALLLFQCQDRRRGSVYDLAATMQYPRCAILKVSESTVDAMRYSYRNRPLQNEPQHAASKNTKLSAMLNALVDDFAASGDSDNLLKINAYIRMYFQQEANHE